MTVYFGDKKITAMYWGGQKIREAWYGGQRVFSGKPVEVMPPTPGWYDARDWLRAKLTEYGEDYRTVQELPFEIDAGESSNLDSMFRGCSSLTTVPDMDASQVTDMQSMFNGCSSLTTVPDMDTGQVTIMSDMFRGCSSLTDGNVRLIGKRTGVSTTRMIQDSGLTREPFYDSSGRPI